MGLVLDPTSTTSLTLDAWRIKRTDEISPGSTVRPSPRATWCAATTTCPARPTAAPCWRCSVDYVNANATTVEGFDFDINQRFDMGRSGKLALDLQWTRISSRSSAIEPDGTRFEYAGTHGNCDVTNCIGTPKDKVNFGATWDIGSFSMSGIVNYIGSIDNIGLRRGRLRQLLRRRHRCPERLRDPVVLHHRPVGTLEGRPIRSRCSPRCRT